MVFNGQSFDGALFILVFLWLGVMSVFLVRMISHYNRLTHGVTNANLKEVLEGILTGQQRVSKKVLDIESTIARMHIADSFHIQRIGIVRFNPFSDTGGAQSFSLAIVDSGDNGIMMTSLYARNGNRWYVKEIVGGRGKGVELSREEESAIKHARIIKV